MKKKDHRARYARTREQMKANQRAYYARNREAILERLKVARADPGWRERKRAADRKRYRQDPVKARAYQLKIRYGLTWDEYQRLHAEQGGRCAICARVPQGRGKSGSLHVDHDHETGHCRGLLCDSCNRAIGLMGDSAATMTKAAMYLQRHVEDRRESA